MKNILFLTTLLSVFIFACKPKESVVPKVITAFEKKFPDATKVRRSKESKEEWEAEFIIDPKEYTANFDDNANWKETEYEIPKSDIPMIVLTALDDNFSTYKINEVEFSETVTAKLYEFEIEDGESTFEIAISNNASLLRKKQL